MALERDLVLVAEDDVANRALLARLLDRGGYRSMAVGDGRDAMRAAVDEHPDLVLLDVGLPGVNGLDVCRRLRSDPRTVALPIILVTGRTASHEVVAGLDAGADDFVRKPYDEAEIMARIRSVLRLARVTAEMVGAHGVIAALANVTTTSAGMAPAIRMAFEPTGSRSAPGSSASSTRTTRSSTTARIDRPEPSPKPCRRSSASRAASSTPLS